MERHLLVFMVLAAGMLATFWIMINDGGRSSSPATVVALQLVSGEQIAVDGEPVTAPPTYLATLESGAIVTLTLEEGQECKVGDELRLDRSPLC